MYCNQWVCLILIDRQFLYLQHSLCNLYKLWPLFMSLVFTINPSNFFVTSVETEISHFLIRQLASVCALISQALGNTYHTLLSLVCFFHDPTYF